MPWNVVDSVVQDLRFGWRILLRSPGISGAVILALALGIGANAAIFSVVDALILHSLRYDDPSTLAVIWEQSSLGLRSAASANFLDWRKQATSFTEIAGWAPASYVLTGLDRPQQITGATVTANFFHTLGVKPVLGRAFLPDEDGLDNPANAAKTVIISYRLWQDVLGGDANVLGRTLQLNKDTYNIAGVLPEDFTFRFQTHGLWIPAALDRSNRDYHYFTAVGRLKTSRSTADAEMKTLAANLASAYPKSNRGWSAQVDDLQEWLIVSHSFKTRLMILFAAVGLVLLIACINVASLLLTRSSARRRELAVRIAMGAPRIRIARQLLTESLLLALAGGLLGLAVGWLLIAAAPSILPPNMIPPGFTLTLTPRVIAFTLGVSILTGVLFGMAPALTATNPDLQETLQDSSRGSTGGRAGQRFRQAMVAIEVALALILLASAGLMTESLRRLTSIDLGFDPKHVAALRVVLPPGRYDAAAALRFHEQLTERVSKIPGVEKAAVSTNLPLAALTMGAPFDLESAPPKDLAQRPGVAYVSATPGYFDTLRISIHRGRGFTAEDRESAPPVAIVNEAFVAKHFPGHELGKHDALGKRLILNRPLLNRNDFAPDVPVEIVGIVANVKLAEMEAPPTPILYVPQAQSVWSATSWLTVRSSLDTGALGAAIRKAIAEMDKAQPVEQLLLLEQTFSNKFAQPRFQSRVISTLALLAFILAVIGIYGVNAYAIAQQRREIGIRIALGATPNEVVRQTVLRAMRWTVAGIVLGLIGAVAAAPVLRGILVGIGAVDPLVLSTVAVLLTAVASIACYVPAQRAARLGPAAALRGE